MMRISSVNIVTFNSLLLLLSSCMIFMMSSMVMVVDVVVAWGYAPLPSRCDHPHPSFVSGSTTKCHWMHPKNIDDASNHNHHTDHQRRRLLQQCTTLGVVMVSTLSQPALAATTDNRLFQSNTLLTNPLLEQLRIWEQEEADNIKYHGELERGDAGNQGKINAYPSLLIPILTISQDISYLYQILSGTTNHQATKEDVDSSYRTALHLLSSNRTTYDTIPFKRIFNAYADNVYYSDPDRANMYLGGGATPKSIQSLAYLLRNEILDNLDNLRAELQYQLHQTDPSDDTEEVRQLITAAYTAMQTYMEIVPPNELQSARELLMKPQNEQKNII